MLSKDLKRAKVLWFNAERGFGFAAIPYEPTDVMVHMENGYNVEPGPEGVPINTGDEPRAPKQGEWLLVGVVDGRKGPKAFPWFHESDYRDAERQSHRPMTFDEAKAYLSGLNCTVLEYTTPPPQFGIHSTTWLRIMWYSETDGEIRKVASGRFEFTPGSTGWPNKVFGSVTISRPGLCWKQTDLRGTEVFQLSKLGTRTEHHVGVEAGVLWNGGWETYAIDPTTVRDITEEELIIAERDLYHPTFELDGCWLKGEFAGRHTTNTRQVVKVLAHLDGGS